MLMQTVLLTQYTYGPALNSFRYVTTRKSLFYTSVFTGGGLAGPEEKRIHSRGKMYVSFLLTQQHWRLKSAPYHKVC